MSHMSRIDNIAVNVKNKSEQLNVGHHITFVCSWVVVLFPTFAKRTLS